MRPTSFGCMKRVKFGGPLDADAEVMHFDRPGKPHKHDRIEVAVCVAGRGFVEVELDGVLVAIPVSPGLWVHVPSGARHHMVPALDQTLAMLIAYRSDGGIE